MLLLLADERTGCRALELQQRAQHTMRIAPCLVVRRPDMDSCFPGTSTASFYVSRDASSGSPQSIYNLDVATSLSVYRAGSHTSC